MSGQLRVAELLRQAGDWLVEPAGEERDESRERPLVVVPPRPFPVVAVVGLARRCGATTVGRALAGELAAREDGAAIVAGAERPVVVGLGSSTSAARLAESLVWLSEGEAPRPLGRLCLLGPAEPSEVAAAARRLAPAVVEVEPGAAVLEAAPAVDRVVLVASPGLEPALAAAVAETVANAARPPLVAVNRAPESGPWLTRADVLIPDSRVGARMALAGRDPRGWLGDAIAQLADLALTPA